jgi:hypothetical protein
VFCSVVILTAKKSAELEFWHPSTIQCSSIHSKRQSTKELPLFCRFSSFAVMYDLCKKNTVLSLNVGIHQVFYMLLYPFKKAFSQGVTNAYGYVKIGITKLQIGTKLTNGLSVYHIKLLGSQVSNFAECYHEHCISVQLSMVHPSLRHGYLYLSRFAA